MAFAEGGYARGLAVVGERGPELVDFTAPGRVYSNDRLRELAGAGGGSVTVNIGPIESTDGPGVRAALAEALPAFVDAARNVVQRDATRPSSMRTAVRGR